MGNALDPARLEALRWALGSTHDLVLAVLDDGRIAFANDAVTARWTGAVAGAGALAALPEPARTPFRAALTSAMTGAPATRFEWGEHGPGGVRCWFATTVSPLHADDGSVAGCLFVSSDVTERKQTELRLRRSEELMVDTQGVAHLVGSELTPRGLRA